MGEPGAGILRHQGGQRLQGQAGGVHAQVIPLPAPPGQVGEHGVVPGPVLVHLPELPLQLSESETLVVGAALPAPPEPGLQIGVDEQLQGGGAPPGSGPRCGPQ